MESRFNRRRWSWLVLLATPSFVAAGLALSACRGRALHAANALPDVGAVAGEVETEQADANPQATGPADLPRDDTAQTGIDSSSSPCSAVTGGYGACAGVLGWGFDGKVCRPWHGCSCAPDCARLFSTARACAQACRAQGGCNPEALVSRGVATFAVGHTCESLEACVPAGIEGELGLDIVGSCQTGGICGDVQTCLLEVPDVIDEALWDRYCAASLIAGVRIECFSRIL
jgi:hypothetical protein